MKRIMPNMIENLNSCLFGMNHLETFNFEIEEEEFRDIALKDIIDLATTLGSKRKLKNLAFKIRNHQFFNLIISKLKSLNTLSFDISESIKKIKLKEFSNSIEKLPLKNLHLNLSHNALENLKDLQKSISSLKSLEKLSINFEKVELINNDDDFGSISDSILCLTRLLSLQLNFCHCKYMKNSHF